MLGLRPWRAAREIIDWELPSRSIYGRANNLQADAVANERSDHPQLKQVSETDDVVWEVCAFQLRVPERL